MGLIAVRTPVESYLDSLRDSAYRFIAAGVSAVCAGIVLHLALRYDSSLDFSTYLNVKAVDLYLLPPATRVSDMGKRRIASLSKL